MSLSLGLSILSPTAWADDDDDLYESGAEEDDDDDTKRVEDDDILDEMDPDDDDEWAVPTEEGGEEEAEEEEELDFDDEGYEGDTEVSVAGPGQDTARIYRDELEKVSDLGPDEESLAWERYLKKYPNSLFKSRIDARMDQLAGDMYSERIEDSYQRIVDAGKAEIQFSQPLQLESIDPRTRIHGGFEWGFPAYINLMAGGEYQLMRELSVHGVFRSRYTGQNLEAGLRYAVVKSARTNLLVTILADGHLNLNPIHPGVRPQLGLGKRFTFGEMFLDAQLQGGTDLLFMQASDDSSMMSPRLVGGASFTLAPSPDVRIFAETSTYMKGAQSDVLGSFRFNVISFGIKFMVRRSSTENKLEAGAGASVPYTSNYWSHHFGSIMGDVHYYLD